MSTIQPVCEAASSGGAASEEPPVRRGGHHLLYSCVAQPRTHPFDQLLNLVRHHVVRRRRVANALGIMGNERRSFGSENPVRKVRGEEVLSEADGMTPEKADRFSNALTEVRHGVCPARHFLSPSGARHPTETALQKLAEPLLPYLRTIDPRR